jgi:hypothetical protein
MVNSGWLFDFNAIKAREKRDLLAAFEGVDADKTDLAPLYPFFARTIKAWPFAGSPQDTSAYPELGLAEEAQLSAAWMEAFQQISKPSGTA